jgi:hypothetical protein
MALPSQPVTLPVKDLEQLNRNLSDMRHDINNHLSLMVAALELIRYKMKKGTVLEAWERLKASPAAAGLEAATIQDFENKLRENLDQTDKMVVTLGDQPGRITEAVRRFSVEFEKTLGITRP